MLRLALLGLVSAVAALCAVALAALRRGLSAPPGPAFAGTKGSAGAVAAALVPVFLVTVGAVCLEYAFLFFQSTATFIALKAAQADARKKGERAPTVASVKYSGIATLRADRTVGNYLEQLTPFLLGLYAHAILVDANRAALLGWAWLGFRSYYPGVFGAPPFLFASTLPAYGVVWYLLATATWSALQL